MTGIICVLVAWLIVACAVAPVTGRGITLADEREARP
jgi:hypothetical protein